MRDDLPPSVSPLFEAAVSIDFIHSLAIPSRAWAVFRALNRVNAVLRRVNPVPHHLVVHLPAIAVDPLIVSCFPSHAETGTALGFGDADGEC